MVMESQPLSPLWWQYGKVVVVSQGVRWVGHLMNEWYIGMKQMMDVKVTEMVVVRASSTVSNNRITIVN